MEPALGVSLTFMLAAILHTSAGFGAALVAMAILVPAIGLATSAPLVAIVVMTLQCLIALRYRDQLAFDALRPLIVAMLAGILIGIWGARQLSEEVLLVPLGVFILVYVALNCFGITKIQLSARRRWATLMGLGSGILSGAYNVGGPMIVMYLQARGHPPDAFRANVQAVFLVGTAFVILGHALNGNFTGQVFTYYLAALPGVVLGFAIGATLASFIPNRLFRWVVLGLLAVLGLQLLIG